MCVLNGYIFVCARLLWCDIFPSGVFCVHLKFRATALTRKRSSSSISEQVKTKRAVICVCALSLRTNEFAAQHTQSKHKKQSANESEKTQSIHASSYSRIVFFFPLHLLFLSFILSHSLAVSLTLESTGNWNFFSSLERDNANSTNCSCIILAFFFFFASSSC